MKPFSQSCVQNQQVILEIIKPLCQNLKQVLEIGSGTGQHAIYFSRQMPWLNWQTSDRIEHHQGIKMWIDEAKLSNVIAPLDLDVVSENWPTIPVELIFSANTLHIMHWDAVQSLFKYAGKILGKQGLLVIYGPFNYQNKYTSASNERFDQWLKNRDPHSAIRHFEDLDNLAKKAHLNLYQDYQMPANNRILCWLKQ